MPNKGAWFKYHFVPCRLRFKTEINILGVNIIRLIQKTNLLKELSLDEHTASCRVIYFIREIIFAVVLLAQTFVVYIPGKEIYESTGVPNQFSIIIIVDLRRHYPNFFVRSKCFYKMFQKIFMQNRIVIQYKDMNGIPIKSFFNSNVISTGVHQVHIILDKFYRGEFSCNNFNGIIC